MNFRNLNSQSKLPDVRDDPSREVRAIGGESGAILIIEDTSIWHVKVQIMAKTPAS